MRKFLSLLLAMCMACSLCMTGASAAGNDDDIDDQDVFNIRVPDGLDIYMDKSGRAGIVGNPVIENLGDRDVEIAGIRVAGESGWDVLDFNNDFSGMAVNEKKLAMAFRGDGTSESGEIALSEGNWTVSGNSGLDLDAEVKMPAQDACEDTRIATVHWDFDWAGDSGDSGNPGSIEISVLPGEHGMCGAGSVMTDETGRISVFPDVTSDVSYKFDHWENQDGEIIDGTTVMNEGDGIRPVFVVDLDYRNYLRFTVTSRNRGQVGYTGVENEDLVIPETFLGGDGNWYVVVAIDNGAFGGCSNLASVTMPDTVESIGDSAFRTAKCRINNIPKNVLSIGEYAFEYDMFDECVIPDGVLSIGHSAFGSCTYEITGVTVPASVKRVGDSCFAFSNLTEADWVTSADIPTYCFRGCMDLDTVNIRGSVSVLSEGAFFSCGIKRIQIPDSVIVMGTDTFSGCQSLSSVRLSRNCRVIPEDFCWGCGSLREITIPYGVTEIGKMAFYQTGLESVSLPDSLTKIGDTAFEVCERISELSVPSSVTSIGTNAFRLVPAVRYSGTATGSPWGAKRLITS